MHSLQQLRSGELRGTSGIKLSCGLTELPAELFELADTLEMLDLSGNQLNKLPDDFGRFKKLKIAFFSENPFTEFPAQLADCPKLEMVGFKACQIETIPENAFPESLRWLILTDNCIEKLPDSIGNCLNLQKVALAGNKLKNIPEAMRHCRKIELLRISANQIGTLPDWLFSLPKLAWLAFGGNPCLPENNLRIALPEFDWSYFQIHEKLGEGASGNIWKATLKNDFQADFPEEVAIKVFKGAVTSDGLPEDEMNASILAGNHPNLVSVLGKITDHPDGKQGLVMKLIPPDFKNLGNPPSFETCTRDTFPEKTTFSIEEVIRIVSGIASAALQFHTNGCMHGDLYAHNILINHAAEPLFGDFGAATIYNGLNPAQAEKLQKIEVRAFGYLLDDLITRLEKTESVAKELKMLEELRAHCLNEAVEQRPFFREINRILSGL